MATTDYQKLISSVKTKVDWEKTTRRVDNPDDYSNAHKSKIDFYNENAGDYNEDFTVYKHKGPQMVATCLHKYLDGKVDAKILDVCAGTGFVATELKKLAPYNNIVGLDAAAKMLEVAQESQLYVETIAEPFNVDSGIPHNSYDALMCAGGFLPGHLKAEAVKEMCAIVKPGGYIVIGCPVAYLTTDKDISQLRPLILQVAEAGTISVISDEEIEGAFLGKVPYRRFVLKKL